MKLIIKEPVKEAVKEALVEYEDEVPETKRTKSTSRMGRKGLWMAIAMGAAGGAYLARKRSMSGGRTGREETGTSFDIEESRDVGEGRRTETERGTTQTGPRGE